MGNIFKKKINDESISFISNDNLILSDIQERLDSYEEKNYEIKNNVDVLKSNYFSITTDFRGELNELRREYNLLDTKCIKLNKEYRTLSILNKTYEEQLGELENKLLEIENEKIFLDLEKNENIIESSRYLDT
uniref:Uncharacterized protein n=1 Tax=viral metagenome TaxID=1070528 RepID=A0A6C0JBP6_9ZZZZ